MHTQKPVTSLAIDNRQDLTGWTFTSPRYSCVWTVLRYHRCGNWVCEEPDHKTTCEFHESEILATGKCNNFLEDPFICYSDGEPKGQCQNCGGKH